MKYEIKNIIRLLSKVFLMLKTEFCHSEQSEESGFLATNYLFQTQILHFAQNDKNLRKNFTKRFCENELFCVIICIIICNKVLSLQDK